MAPAPIPDDEPDEPAPPPPPNDPDAFDLGNDPDAPRPLGDRPPLRDDLGRLDDLVGMFAPEAPTRLDPGMVEIHFVAEGQTFGQYLRAAITSEAHAARVIANGKTHVAKVRHADGRIERPAPLYERRHPGV